jgi:hypothetical protein
MSLSDIIKHNRSSLSHSSVRTYVSILNNLSKRIKCPELTKDCIVKHEQDIIKDLSDRPPRNRKTIYSALIVILDDGTANKTLDKFRTLMMKDSEKTEEEDAKQEKNVKQKENWIEWSEVNQVYNDLEGKVKPLFKLKSLSKSMIRIIQQYVMLSLFVKIKPRRTMDWIDFKLRNFDKTKDNYMEGNKLIFNSFKTKKYLGKQVIDLPKDLKKILNEWSKINTKDNLLFDTKGNPMNASKFTQELYNIFGKNISTNMLRHIYLSHLLKNTPALLKLQENMKDMGQTNLKTQLQYVKR